MAEKKGYKPEVTVVRNPRGTGSWVDDDGRYPDRERAYLVRGLPMPGEKVRQLIMRDPCVVEVEGLFIMVQTKFLGEVGCSNTDPRNLTPYDPEAEKVERVAKAIYFKANPCLLWNRRGSDAARYRDAARAAIKAMEAENG